jgi:putative tricarboxylic transport membrane protein
MTKKGSLGVLGAFAAALLAAGSLPASADWKPEHGLEFIVTSGPGGGTDRFARTVQAAILNNKLLDQSVTVINKPGANGAEGLVDLAKQKGNPNKVAFGTSNVWILPLGAKMPYQAADLTPLAIMAFDEFIVWVNANEPYKSIKEYIDAASAKPGAIKMGGGMTKDIDHVLVKVIENAAHVSFTYVPFKGGGEAGIQLAGGHIVSNTNNPAENLEHWRSGKVRPLCVTSPQRMSNTTKITDTQSWADVPTCKEAGLDVDFRGPRTVWLAGGITGEQLKFYQDLFGKVRETKEWKDFISSSELGDAFVTGADFDAFIKKDEDTARAIFDRAGWLLK